MFPYNFFCHFCPFYRFTVLPRAPPPSDFYRFTVLPRAPPPSRFYRFTVLPFYRAPSDLQILPFYRFTVFTAYICTKHALTSRPTQRQHRRQKVADKCAKFKSARFPRVSHHPHAFHAYRLRETVASELAQNFLEQEVPLES